MNQKIMENYAALAQSTGLRLDSEGGVLYGQRGAFDVTVYAQNSRYPYMLSVSLAAQRSGGPLTKEEGKQFKKGSPAVTTLAQASYLITMSLKNIANQEKLQESLNESINALVMFLQSEGFQNCCQACGKVGPTDTCCIRGNYGHLCPDCFTSVQQNQIVLENQQAQRGENVVAGIVGALLGTLLGVACIIILSQLGYVAALSGVVMAVCTLKGYELLGGKLSRRGVVISVVLMLLMTFVGDRADWAIVVAQELEIDFVTAFRVIPLLIEEEIITAGMYWGNLAMLYLFLLLGAVPTIHSTVKERKNQQRISRLAGDQVKQ